MRKKRELVDWPQGPRILDLTGEKIKKVRFSRQIRGGERYF